MLIHFNNGRAGGTNNLTTMLKIWNISAQLPLPSEDLIDELLTFMWNDGMFRRRFWPGPTAVVRSYRRQYLVTKDSYAGPLY